MEIKDYLHLYLGSDFQMKNNKGWGVPRKLNTHDLHDIICYYPSSTRLILRQLSSMTEEEAKDIAVIMFGKPDSVPWRMENKVNYLNVSRRHYHRSFTIDLASGDIDIYDGGELQTTLQHHYITVYMLSKGFDLFNLIENGLAIDLETIKQ